MINRSISVIIPVYNEEEYLPKTIQEVYRVLNENFYDFEIIFVDDGSTDNSFHILSNFQEEYSSVVVLRNFRNQGLGAALQKGFSAATKEVIFYLDCDLPFDPILATKMVLLLDTCDIVIGKRDRWDNAIRRSYSYIYNFIIQRLFRLDIYDINVGMKVFKRSILDKIQLSSSGSFINTEFLAEARRNGFSIRKVNCEYCRRVYGYSKMDNLKNIYQIMSEMFKYYFKRKKGN